MANKCFSFLFEFKDGQIAWTETHELSIDTVAEGMKSFEKYHGRFGDKMIAYRMSDGWNNEADEAVILLPITPAREEILKRYNYIK